MHRSRTAEGRHFLVELASNDDSWTDLTEAASRARSAVVRARRTGADVAFVRSVYAPESNVLFLVYRALSEEAVLAAARDAGLRPHSVSPAIEGVDRGSR